MFGLGREMEDAYPGRDLKAYISSISIQNMIRCSIEYLRCAIAGDNYGENAKYYTCNANPYKRNRTPTANASD
jgi:hypothetical protein